MVTGDLHIVEEFGALKVLIEQEYERAEDIEGYAIYLRKDTATLSD